MYAKLFFYVFVLSNLFLIFAENEYPPWKKAINKEMLPNELKDVYDFEDNAVIIRGHDEEIPYVIEKDVPLKFQICREKPEKCEHDLAELKTIQFCYKALIANANDQLNCPCGTDMGGFNIEEQNIPDKTIILVRAPHGTENEHVGIPFGECVNAEIVKEKNGNYELNFPQIQRVDVLVMNPLITSSFEGNTNLRKISLHIFSTNKVCGFYFKFLNGFFPLYEWIDPPTTTLPTPPPSTKPTTATTMKTKTTSLPTVSASFPTTEEKEYTTKIVTITDKSVEDVSESSLILWILIGVGAFIIVALIIALIVWCCIRHKFKKPSKKSLSDKKIPEQNQQQQKQQAILPPSSTAAQCNPSSEASQKLTPFIEKQQKNKDSVIKKVSNIKSIQTAVPPPVGLRGFRNADELYRLALTAETREERNVFLDLAIESANEELKIWQSSAFSQTNDTTMLPTISKRILNAKKAGVKLISTKDPTKLIPEQMDGLTYEQINDLALIENYPNVRYALFERASELIRRASEDSAPDAYFDKDYIEPLLYQYQLGIYEINEEQHKDVIKRTKLLDEILKKKENV